MNSSASGQLSHATPNLHIAITLCFVSFIAGLPLIQFLGEVVTQPAKLPTALQLVPMLIHAVQDGMRTPGSLWRQGLAANSHVCQELRTYETNVTTSAWPVRGARDRLQVGFSAFLATGNEQVDIGRDGWMYFRPDVDALTSPGFLQPEVTRPGMARGTRQTNPLPAIQQFAADLGARGIRLCLLPIPSKASIHLGLSSSTLNADTPSRQPIHNVDFQQFVKQFPKRNAAENAERTASDRAHVLLIGDLDQQFLGASDQGIPCYLKTDTHWTPQGLEVAVQHVAQALRNQGILRQSIEQQHSRNRWHPEVAEPIQKSGDTATLLGNMAQLGWGLEQETPTRIIDSQQQDWQPDSQSEILILGDSFLNIYSQEELGWGTSAGFAEQLSHELALPLDRIAINAGGALASRQELIRQLQKAHDRLAGKKVVIWEFAERELSFGDWQVLPLPESRNESSNQTNQVARDNSAEKSRLTTLSDAVAVTGEVLQVGRLANPQSMPYREALLPIHLRVDSWPADKKSAEKSDSKEIVVYVWGLKDRRLTPAAAMRKGQTVQIKLIPWSEVESKYGRFARVELDDPDSVLLDLPTYWGEF